MRFLSLNRFTLLFIFLFLLQISSLSALQENEYFTNAIQQDDDPTPPPPDSNDVIKPIPTGGSHLDPVFAPVREPASYSAKSAIVAPTITVWYEDDLSFGQNGNPQQWVNILGNVSGVAPNRIDLSYRLNGTGGYQSLTIGP